MHYSTVTTTDPTFQGIILGLLAGAAVFSAARYFHEKTARKVMYYIGIAFVLDTVRYAGRNLLAETPALLVVGGAEILVLYGCVAHLRQTARGQTVHSAQQGDREFFNKFLTLGLVTGLGVAILPFMIGLLFPIIPSSQFPGWASRVWGIGLSVSGCIMTLLGPARPWKLGFAMGLGLPVVLLIRLAVLLLTDPSSPNLMPITSVMSVVLGPVAAFTGVFLAFTIKGLCNRTKVL
jgi:hypothetical protein